MERRNEEDRLVVTLNERSDAKQKGAEYVRGSFFSGNKNGWFAPKAGTDEEGRPTDPAIRLSLFEKYGQKEVAEEKINESLWKEALNSRDTLKVAAMIRDKGIPAKEIQRVEMLRILRNPGKSLRIQFDDLRDFSKSFKEAYSEERIKKIIEKHIVGGTDYQITLENSNATPEEKELIKYVFGF